MLDPPRHAHRRWLWFGRSLIAMVSAIVVGLTGYAWLTVGSIDDGLTKADVLDPRAGEEAPVDGAIDVLLVGIDSRTDAQGHPIDPDVLHALHVGSDKGELDTDTLILVHVPNDGSQARAMSIPRDAVVLRPGYGKGKINSAYLAAKNTTLDDLRQQGVTDKAELERKSNRAGAKELIETVELLTDSTIDHYAQVNLLGFYNISVAIGGVPVCLKHDVSDPDHSGAHFHEGIQTIEGKEALAFVRQRYNIPGGSTDLQRERRQQAFLASVAHKVFSAGILTHPSQLRNLLDAAKKAVVIDKNWNLMRFAQQMRSLSSGDIKFATIPVLDIDAHSPRFGSYVKVDPARVRAFVAESQDRSGQSTGPSRSQQPSGRAATSTAHQDITVDVSNAARVNGIADRVLDVLAGHGFTRGESTNATTSDSSTVRYPPGLRQRAQNVADALGDGFRLVPDDTIAAGHVRVLLGSDYAGPGRKAGTPNTNATPATSQAPPTPPREPIVNTDEGPTCVN